jgi:hypothetical protein
MATEPITVYGTGGHDPSKPNANVVAQSQAPVPVEVENSRAILDKARAAIAVNAAYLALPNPTTAQNLAQIRRLTRECNGLIRVLLSAFEDASDT